MKETCKLCGGRIGPTRYGSDLMCYGCGPYDVMPDVEREKLTPTEQKGRWRTYDTCNPGEMS